MREPPANVLELPLEVRAEMALRAAAEKVWEEHAREGLPITIWRDEQIVEVSPEELLARYQHPRAPGDQENVSSDSF
jgi:hypothetical protein